jgi:hypothetical protein
MAYAEFVQKSRAFVAYLQQDLGLAEVERMAIMRPNLLKYRLALDGSRAGDADDHALLGFGREQLPWIVPAN